MKPVNIATNGKWTTGR